MGRWSEITADALNRLGHRTVIHYHNLSTFKGRVAERVNMAARGLGYPDGWLPGWDTISNQILSRAMRTERWDVLLSIQGKLTPELIGDLRTVNPGLRVVFWWGDILTERGRQRIEELHTAVDLVLMSYRGDCEMLSATGLGKLYHFPFAISPGFHAVGELTDAEKRRYGADVAFVGTYYPERGQIIGDISRMLDARVRVWGRSWRRCRSVRGGGALTLQESLLVHAASKISVNVHHHATNGGFNMKFYEIPAAGGFQICDWQEELNRSAFGTRMASFRNTEELVERIRYYLSHDAERIRLATELRDLMMATETYEQRFASLLQIL